MKSIIKKLDEIGFVNVRLTKSAKISHKIGDKSNISNPKAYIYSKDYKCPVCGMDFENWALKVSTLKMGESGIDLRPVYMPLDPLYYDVILCPYCGYGAMGSYFQEFPEDRVKEIKDNVSPNFVYVDYPMLYTVDMVVERYLVALLNTLIKGAASSERAYLCLKLAWLNRDKRDLGQESLFHRYALAGFKAAYEDEEFPICGMDKPTLSYIIADLSRRTGEFDEALYFINQVISARDSNQRLHDKAVTVKDLIRVDRVKEDAFAAFRKVVQNSNR